MKRVGPVVSLALMVMVMVTGCTSGKSRIMEPEDLIGLVLEQCEAGQFEAAVQHFEDGPKMWETQPQFVRDYFNRLCSMGQAKSFEIRDRLDRGESTVLIQITTYTDESHEEGLRTMTWHFARAGRKWLITKVE